MQKMHRYGSFFVQKGDCYIAKNDFYIEKYKGEDECNMIDKLTNRITDEITAFRMSEKKKSVGDVYNDWYEVCVKEELYSLFADADLDGYEEMISWLNTKEQPLEFLYQAVLDGEYGFVHSWGVLLEWIDDLRISEKSE